MKEKLEAKLKTIEENFNKQQEAVKQAKEQLMKMEQNLIFLQGAYQVTKELLEAETPKEELKTDDNETETK